MGEVPMTDLKLTGSCLCGAVKYTATGEAKGFFNCHCKRCRKATGTGHASNLFLSGTLDWNQGEEVVKTFKVPEAKRFTNSFCSQCGGRVPRFIEEMGSVMIPAGSLDDEPGMRPQARIFKGSQAEWSHKFADIPSFEEYPG
jgi:hypothetical protein